MRNPFRRKALTASPSVLEAQRSRTLNLIPSLGGTNLTNRAIQTAFETAQSANYAWMYQNSPAVRTVVDLIARNVGQLDLRLYEELDEAERQPRPDHPAALSLRYPSNSQTPDQFIRALVTDFLVNDNAYSLKFRTGNQRPVTLKPIPAQRVTILGDRLFDASGYRVFRTDGSFVVVEDPNDMIHWRGWNPQDPRIGLSRLETLRSVVAEDAALQTATVELAKSGLTQPVYGFRPLEAPSISDPARKGLEEDLGNRIRGSNRKPFILEEGTELRPLGVSPRDAQMLDVRKWAIQQVAAIYGVHPASVGLDGDIEEAQKVLYTDVLPPICEALTRQLDLSVLQVEYGETEFCFEFNLDEKHMGDDRLKSLVSATGRPVLTTNEGRAMVNKPPIDGGDELVTPANVIVGDNPKPSVDVMPIQDPNKPLQDGSYREPKELASKATPGLSEALTPARWETRSKADIDRQHRYTDEVAGELERFYARQARSLLSPKSVKEFDSDRWDRELAADLERLVRSIVDREGGLYVARLAGDDFDMRRVEHYLKAMSAGTAEGINRVTAKDIEDLGAEDALARARGQRADVAAASIGTRATVFARTEAAKQAPHPERRTKTWIADTDRHANLNGATVSLESSWGGIVPGSEPACKCSCSIS